MLFSLPGTGDRKFTHAVTFGPEGEPHGFETYDGSDAVRKVADNFTSACASGEVFPTHLYDRNLRVGTFFDDYAFLFEVFAYSYEGEPFLESGGFYPRDWPFGPPADWPSCWEYPLDVDALRATDLYKARVWDASLTASNHHGGLRGLWDEGQGEWENDTVRIQHHESLGEYARTGGTDLVQMGRMFCGSEWREFQTVEGSTLEDRFYDDLEACHIAILLTYGGLKARPNHIQQAYQLRCDLDRWCPLHVEGQPALGLGNLRVLLLRTGSSMNWLREPPAKGGGLEDDWMNFHVADGLRLVCGHDGRHEAAIHLREREGWYFCRRYGGQALSVTDAWIRTALDVDYSGSPVVVAYGATLAEAAGTLYDGRFDKTPGGKGWIVAVASFRVGAPD